MNKIHNKRELKITEEWLRKWKNTLDQIGTMDLICDPKTKAEYELTESIIEDLENQIIRYKKEKKKERIFLFSCPIIGILSAVLLYFLEFEGIGISHTFIRTLMSLNITLGFLPLIAKIINLWLDGE